MSRAEYMREYRASKVESARKERGFVTPEERITELEAEVKHLRAELEIREEQIAGQANSSPDPAEAFRTVTADGTKGMARGPRAPGSWLPEFRPAPKSVSAPKPKGRLK